MCVLLAGPAAVFFGIHILRHVHHPCRTSSTLRGWVHGRFSKAGRHGRHGSEKESRWSGSVFLRLCRDVNYLRDVMMSQVRHAMIR